MATSMQHYGNVGAKDICASIRSKAESQKAGWAKTIFLKQAGSDEEASVRLINIKTSEVVFAYAVHKRNSIHGKQSSAESCAKHLKAAMYGKD
jgi:hypothetical protein